MLNTNCSSCDMLIKNHSYTPIKSKRGMKIFVCSNCGLIFSKSTTPYISRPKPSMSCDADRSSIKYTKQLVLGDHLKFIREKGIELSNYRFFLDIGSNRGDFINHLKNNIDFENVKIDAIETDPDIVCKYEKYSNVTTFIARFESCDISENKYDFIYFVHTLEHLENLNESLLKIRKSLKYGGIIFLAVPNIEYGSYNTFTEIFIDTHTYHFRYNVLINICKKAGFKILFKNNDGEAEIKLILTVDYSKIYNNLTENQGNESKIFLNKYINCIESERNKIKRASEKIDMLFNENYLCWGAGRLFDGLVVIGNINTNKIIFLIDKYLHQYFDNFYDIKVKPIEFLDNIDKNTKILICSFEYEQEIIINAKELGFKNLYTIKQFLENEI
jgi:SAM-dependent methyltransferase